MLDTWPKPHEKRHSAITKLKSVLQCKDMLGAYWGCRDHSLLLNFRILVLITLILSSCGVLRILGVKNKLIKTISTMWHRTHRDPPAGSCWGPAGWCSQAHADWHRNWWQRITEPWTKGGWEGPQKATWSDPPHTAGLISTLDLVSQGLIKVVYSLYAFRLSAKRNYAKSTQTIKSGSPEFPSRSKELSEASL